MINLVIAEDHNCIIDGIEMFFEFEEDISIIAKVNDGIELLQVLEKKHVNMVITDIRMPKMDGIEATKIIQQKYPHIKVIAFTMVGQKHTVKKVLEAGAKGYLLKNAKLKTLLEAVRKIHSGLVYYDPNINLEKIDSSLDKAKTEKGILTKRQYEILELIGQEYSNKDIAEKLSIGVYTVGSHRKNMIEKLGLKGRNALLTYALNRKYESE
ncbi:response regulator [Kordia sp.]|uniref:response regulator n=1 Tax=Kordia sp. TaxID=1965332 RepID=UPI003D2715C6